MSTHLLFKRSILLAALTLLCSTQHATAANALPKDPGTMVFAVDVIRHGDRAPIGDFPSAPHKWPQGLGQLTPEGMNQEFQLGKEFRARYVDKNHLLPEKYDVETMYVRASDIDRTLMSAESTLMGLYPLGQGPLTDAGTDGLPNRYQPIPIHTRPTYTDGVLIPGANKTLKEAYKRYVYESPEWKERLAKEQPNFERWSKLTGIQINDMQQMSLIGDTVHIRRLHNVPMPEGMTKADADAMAELGEWVFAANFKPPEVGQISGLGLLKLIEKHLADATKGSSKLKYVLFSAHDSTISSVLSALKAPTSGRPHYSSDLSISLWKNADGYTVKAMFNGEPVNFPSSVEGTAPLAKFAELAPATSNESSTTPSE